MDEPVLRILVSQLDAIVYLIKHETDLVTLAELAAGLKEIAREITAYADNAHTFEIYNEGTWI